MLNSIYVNIYNWSTMLFAYLSKNAVRMVGCAESRQVTLHMIDASDFTISPPQEVNTPLTISKWVGHQSGRVGKQHICYGIQDIGQWMTGTFIPNCYGTDRRVNCRLDLLQDLGWRELWQFCQAENSSALSNQSVDNSSLWYLGSFNQDISNIVPSVVTVVGKYPDTKNCFPPLLYYFVYSWNWLKTSHKWHDLSLTVSGVYRGHWMA